MNDDLGNCKHEKRSFIQSSKYSGAGDSGRSEIYICLNCGEITIFGDRNFESFDIRFRLALPEQVEAAERWISLVEGRDTRSEKIEEAVKYITDWRDKAYPLDIFPEPDSARAHELLQAGGLTLDAVSVSMARHILTRVCEILKEKGLLHE